MSQSMSIPASQTRRPATMSAGMSDRWFSILLITPAMVVILVFALLPLAYALDVSFRFADLTRGRLGDFVGLDNYRIVLADEAFWKSVGVTLQFTVSAVVLEMVLGIAIAFLINGATAGKGIIRSLMVLPLATSAAVTGLFWRYLYDTQFGLINYFLGLLHLPQPNWLGDYTIALWSVVLFDVWQWTPFVALIALAPARSRGKVLAFFRELGTGPRKSKSGMFARLRAALELEAKSTAGKASDMRKARMTVLTLNAYLSNKSRTRLVPGGAVPRIVA